MDEPMDFILYPLSLYLTNPFEGAGQNQRGDHSPAMPRAGGRMELHCGEDPSLLNSVLSSNAKPAGIEPLADQQRTPNHDPPPRMPSN